MSGREKPQIRSGPADVALRIAAARALPNSRRKVVDRIVAGPNAERMGIVPGQRMRHLIGAEDYRPGSPSSVRGTMDFPRRANIRCDPVAAFQTDVQQVFSMAPVAPRTNRFIIKCGAELMSQALFSLFSVRSEPTMMVKTIMGSTTPISG